MRRNGVNSITYGALFVSLVGVLVYINRLTANLIDIYFFWIIPIVIVVYRCKFDFRDTLLTCFAMLLLTIVLAGLISTSTFYVSASIVAGVTYGQGLMKGRSAAFLIGSVIAVSLVVMFLTSFVFASFFGYNLTEEIVLLRNVIQDYAGKVGEIDGQLSQIVLKTFSENMLWMIIILSCVVTSILEGILVHLLTYIFLRKLKMAVLPPVKPLSEVYCPKWLKVFVFAALFASLAAKISGVDNYNFIILPVQSIALVICFFFGYICLATFLALRTGQNKRRKFGASLLICLFCLFFSPIVVGIGLFDIFSGVRKKTIERIKKNVQQQNG
ncbi:MAG: DUF2232 domain-containing protein [Erysipelotrichia bacterium]|nr:DUF2232 domain-containing protein [Erysipelotrichia bacterium]